MAELVLIYGRSGSGKSCSARNFDNLFIININDKQLPYKPLETQKVWNCGDYDKIKAMLLKAHSNGYNSIMIDDCGYLITNDFMNRPTSAVGNQAFDFYNKLATKYFNLFVFIKNELPKDTIVYVVMHEDIDDQGYHKLKTIGKILDDKVCLEGLSTIALRTCKNNNKYCFCTNTDGLDVTKSPMNMFDTQFVDNDLKIVDDKIRAFYGFAPNYQKPESK